MERVVFQTFWTKPMMGDLLQTNLHIAAISLFYAHRSGYAVHMHTDSKGMELLADYGYDRLLPTLDNIPEDIPASIFAYGKILAIECEPLGAVHTDYDVFLKQPCIDVFFDNPGIDILLQCREVKNTKFYEELRNQLKDIGVPSELAIDHPIPSNVGVIGFNNEELRKEYVHRYKACVEFYKNKTNHTISPDLFFEQINIDYLVHQGEYNVFYLLGNVDYWSDQHHFIANRIGYQHLQGEWKYTTQGREFIRDFSEKLLSNETKNH